MTLTVPREPKSTARWAIVSLSGGINESDEVVLPENGILVDHFASERLDLVVDLLHPLWMLMQRLSAFGCKGAQKDVPGHGAPLSTARLYRCPKYASVVLPSTRPALHFLT